MSEGFGDSIVGVPEPEGDVAGGRRSGEKYDIRASESCGVAMMRKPKPLCPPRGVWTLDTLGVVPGVI